MAKQKPDIVIDRLGTHLFRVTRKDGTESLSWDWNKLLAEVQAATADRKVVTVDLGEMTPVEEAEVVEKVTKAVKARKDLVKETEAKVAKTRSKKSVNDQITDAVTTNKPVAKKKPTAKKSTK